MCQVLNVSLNYKKNKYTSNTRRSINTKRSIFKLLSWTFSWIIFLTHSRLYNYVGKNQIDWQSGQSAQKLLYARVVEPIVEEGLRGGNQYKKAKMMMMMLMITVMIMEERIMFLYRNIPHSYFSILFILKTCCKLQCQSISEMKLCNNS